MDDTISRKMAIDALLKEFERDTPKAIRAKLTLENLPSAQPDMSEYSDKLWKAAYERGKAETQPDLDEVYAHAETEAEARFHAEIVACGDCKHWIPCSERLPETEEQVLIYAWNVHYVLAKYKEIRTCDGVYKMAWVTEDAYNIPQEIKHEVICWMPLPEPYAERRTDGV